MSANELSIIYNGDAFPGLVGHESKVKMHSDVIADGVGFAKIYNIRAVDGLLPIIPEAAGPGGTEIIYVDPSTVLLRDAVPMIEVDRMITIASNKRKLAELGLDKTDTPKQKKNTRNRMNRMTQRSKNRNKSNPVIVSK
jgi:hypothetical protein